MFDLVLIGRTRTVWDSVTTLETLKVDSKRRRDWFKLLFKRGDVQAAVTKVREKIRVAKERFSVRRALYSTRSYLSYAHAQLVVAADTNLVAHEIRRHVVPQSPAPPVKCVLGCFAWLYVNSSL